MAKKIKKLFVLDTNVLISAVYFPTGSPGQALNLARKRKFLNVISPFIMEEIARILRDKFLWDDARIQKTLRWIASFSDLIDPPFATIYIIPHHSDNRILECAVEGKAQFIVSGDRHLKDLGTYQGIRIVDPATFLELIAKPI